MIFAIRNVQAIRVIKKICPKVETEDKFHQNWN